MIHRASRTLNRALVMPAVVTIAVMTLTGCDMDVSIDGKEGVPLAELDTSGPAPSGIALMGPDTIIVTEGDALAIATQGDPDAIDALRFVLTDGTLGVMRANDAPDDIGTATVRVTMPAPESIAMLGSGRVEAGSMASVADVDIGGSGTVSIARLAAESFDLNIGGSGSLSAAGAIDRLDLNVAGSGNAMLDRVAVGIADITMAGSGSASLASDGTVDANILGSGDVVVTGNAECSVNAIGSGTLECAPSE